MENPIATSTRATATTRIMFVATGDPFPKNIARYYTKARTITAVFAADWIKE